MTGTADAAYAPPASALTRGRRALLDNEALLKAVWADERPLRRPENGYRMHEGRIDIRNHFLPDRHEHLNETGTFILMLCDGEHSLTDIWRKVCEEFEAPDEMTTLRDVVRMVRYFQRFFVVYGSTVAGEQHVDVRHPRGVRTTTPITF